MISLRPYQIEAVEGLRQRFRGGAKKVLLTCPTGGGKTVVFSHVVASAVSRGSRALILAHRRELVAQASQKLNAFGVVHGIVQAGFPMAPHRPVSARVQRGDFVAGALPAPHDVAEELEQAAHGRRRHLLNATTTHEVTWKHQSKNRRRLSFSKPSPSAKGAMRRRMATA